MKTARQFALEGAQVAICGRDEGQLTKTADAIKQASGQTVHPFVADVAQPADVHAGGAGINCQQDGPDAVGGPFLRGQLA